MTGLRKSIKIAVAAVSAAMVLALVPARATAVRAFYLGDDGSTQGDWTGRYGRLQYVLWAIRPWRRDSMGGPGEVMSLAYATGEAGWHPIHFPTRGAERSLDPRYLLNPEARFRSMGELNDWTNHYPDDMPDLFIRMELPQGWHLLSIYWVNNDFQDRHYGVRLESAHSDVLAECKVEDFEQGFYTVFAVEGQPGDSTLVVRVICERGDIIKLSGLFLDQLRLPEVCPLDLGPDQRERGPAHSRPEEAFAGMPQLWERSADTYFRAYQRYAAAAGLLTKAAERGDPYDLWELWQCQRATGDHRAAEQTLRRFAQGAVARLGDDQGRRALDDLVTWCDERGESRLAAVVLDWRLEGAPTSPENRGRCESLVQRWFDLFEDLAAAEALGRLSAFDLPTDRLRRIHLRIARIYQEWDHPAESEEWYRRLAARLPDTTEGRAAARRVYGVVSASDSNARLGDASVRLLRETIDPPGELLYDSWPKEWHVHSDPDGTYQLQHLPPGSYRWWVSAEEYYHHVSIPLEIADDDGSLRLDLTLDPKPEAEG